MTYQRLKYETPSVYFWSISSRLLHNQCDSRNNCSHIPNGSSTDTSRNSD